MAGNVAQTAGNFMFVEYAKPAEVVKGQKRRRGGPSEVRAHITKNYHRALRVKRLQSLKKGEVAPSVEEITTLPAGQAVLENNEDCGDDADADNGVFAADEDRDIQTINPQRLADNTSATAIELVPPSSWTTSSPGDATFSWSPGTNSGSTPSSTVQSLCPAHPLHLRTLLGEGRVDPFDVFSTTNLSPFIHRVLDHAVMHSWPATIPRRESALVPTNPVKSSWLRLAMEHPVAFHAFLYATSLHVVCKYEGREVYNDAPLMRLSHKVETIKLVNEQLQALTLSEKPRKKGKAHRRREGDDDDDPSEKMERQKASSVPTDALIMAVIILSVHHQRDETVYPTVHPVSPMAKVNNLDVYGAMINDEKHIQGILLLVNQKGGLERMELYAMADTLQLCDLYFASKYSCVPNFSWRGPVTSLVLDGKYVLDQVAIDLDSKLGSGFRYLRRSCAGQQLTDVLDAYSEITVALDHYFRGGPTAPLLVDLADVRNCTQHRLLSQLPRSSDMSDPEACLHHATRLATLIFSEMVILPLPPTQGVKPRLALSLQQCLETCRLVGCWESHNQILLWALTLGAIAASYTISRAWYIDQLLLETSLMQIENWFVLELTCSRFLWWKPVCTDPLRVLWDEMMSPTTIDVT